MPLIHLKTNQSISKEQKVALKSAFGKAITVIPGKSESWLMVQIEPDCTLYFKGDDAPAAMVDVSIFGKADDKAFDALTAQLCTIVENQLKIDGSRIYVKYAEVPHWGWNDSNF
ncbi:MAG: hypothetical protein LUF89_06890 [Ruminococcus sp.]|nr:hypothetical protein [Ruminococcus sp.]